MMMMNHPATEYLQDLEHLQKLMLDMPPAAAPQPEETRTRRRRRRVAIDIPHELLSHLDKDGIKKWKNRVAAARARERTQKEVHELQTAVEHLFEETRHQHATIEQLRAVIRSLDPHHQAGYDATWDSPEFVPMMAPPMPHLETLEPPFYTKSGVHTVPFDEPRDLPVPSSALHEVYQDLASPVGTEYF